MLENNNENLLFNSPEELAGIKNIQERTKREAALLAKKEAALLAEKEAALLAEKEKYAEKAAEKALERKKRLQTLGKENKEKDRAALAELAERINTMGTLSEQDSAALLSNTETFEEKKYLQALKERCEEAPDSITEEVLKDVPLPDLKQLFDSLVNKTPIAIDDDMINLFNKVIGEGAIHSKTVYRSPDIHA